MSTNTITPGTKTDLTDPRAFLDARTKAIVEYAGKDGIEGWIFDVPTGENVDLNSDVTDHYTESGSFVTDHIVLKPIQITLTGLRGELFYKSPKATSFLASANTVTNALTTVGAFVPTLAPQAQQKLAQIVSNAAYASTQITEIARTGQTLISYFQGDTNAKTLQQKAFADLMGLWNSKQIVTVQTPWGYFSQMAIMTISARQEQNSNDYTDFSITFKEMRFVEVEKTTFDAGAYTSAIDLQNKKTANQGPTQGNPTDPSSPFVPFIPKNYEATHTFIPGSSGVPGHWVPKVGG